MMVFQDRVKSASTSRSSGKIVAVVGASSSGLFASLLLARQGVPVRVFERIDTLEPEPRTLIVTQRMRDLLGRVAEKSIVNEIRRFELFTDGRSATVTLKHPDLIVERQTLIQSLAVEAEKAGVKLELGRRFHRLHPDGDNLVLELERSADGIREEFERIQLLAAMEPQVEWRVPVDGGLLRQFR